MTPEFHKSKSTNLRVISFFRRWKLITCGGNVCKHPEHPVMGSDLFDISWGFKLGTEHQARGKSSEKCFVNSSRLHLLRFCVLSDQMSDPKVYSTWNDMRPRQSAKSDFRGWTHWMFAISSIQMAWFWSVKSKHVGCLFLVDVDWLVNSTLDYSVFVLFWKSQICSEIGFEERNWLMFRKLRYVVQTPKNLPFNGDSSCGYSKMVKDTRNVRNTQMH